MFSAHREVLDLTSESLPAACGGVKDVLHRQITNSTCIGKLFREFVLTTREGSSAASALHGRRRARSTGSRPAPAALPTEGPTSIASSIEKLQRPSVANWVHVFTQIHEKAYRYTWNCLSGGATRPIVIEIIEILIGNTNTQQNEPAACRRLTPVRVHTRSVTYCSILNTH